VQRKQEGTIAIFVCFFTNPLILNPKTVVVKETPPTPNDYHFHRPQKMEEVITMMPLSSLKKERRWLLSLERGGELNRALVGKERTSLLLLPSHE